MTDEFWNTALRHPRQRWSAPQRLKPTNSHATLRRGLKPRPFKTLDRADAMSVQDMLRFDKECEKFRSRLRTQG